MILLDATGVIQSLNGGKMDVVVNGMSMRVSREDVALPMLSSHPMKNKAKSGSTEQPSKSTALLNPKGRNVHVIVQF